MDRLWAFIEPYDLAMLAILLWAIWRGAARGMAWQIASLASMGLSGALALRYYPQVTPYMGDRAPWNQFAAMLAVYVGTSMAIWTTFRIVSGVIDRVRLKEFDQQVGGLFGAAKGLALCLVITFFAVTLSDRLRAQVLRSRSGFFIARLIDRAEQVLPADVHQQVRPYLDRLDRELAPLDYPSRTADDRAGDGWR